MPPICCCPLLLYFGSLAHKHVCLLGRGTNKIQTRLRQRRKLMLIHTHTRGKCLSDSSSINFPFINASHNKISQLFLLFLVATTFLITFTKYDTMMMMIGQTNMSSLETFDETKLIEKKAAEPLGHFICLGIWMKKLVHNSKKARLLQCKMSSSIMMKKKQ